MKRTLSLITMMITAMALTACSETQQTNDTFRDNALRIAGATELSDLAPMLTDAEKDLGFPIELRSPSGTLANSHALADGRYDNTYDASWFASNKYLDLIGGKSKITSPTPIASSPVIIGVKKKVASDLGWDTHRPTWSDIATAAEQRKISFGMTDPASSFSGLSGLVSVSTALSNTGNALTETDIQKVSSRLEKMFSAQTMISGSSGWLATQFTKSSNKADTIINYEHTIRDMSDSGTDIVPIAPSDGVITADYPISPLTTPHDPTSKDKVSALIKWLTDHPDRLITAHLRPVGSPLPTDAPMVFDLPFPASSAVTTPLIDLYSNTLRTPGRTTFILDNSGSMRNQRMDALHSTMSALIDGTAATEVGNVGLRNRESVTIIPFTDVVGNPVTTTFSTTDPTARNTLSAEVNDMEAGGGTAIFDALKSAYQGLDLSGHVIPSLVLMTDGNNENGSTLEDFRSFFASLDESHRSVPLLIVRYGDADPAEMNELATLTGGKVFAADDHGLGDAFKEIRGYQ